MRRLGDIVVIVVAAVVAATPLPRATVERVYSRGVYPLLQPRLTALSNTFSFALFDATAIIVSAAIVALWFVRLRRARRGRAWRAAGVLLLDTAAIAAVLYFWFLMAWGLNYQREPLRALLDFQEDRITPQALRELGRRDVDALNALYGEARESGWPALDVIPPGLDRAFARAQRDLGIEWRPLGARPKRSLLDFYFRRVAVDGMTDPFFLETLANQSLLPFERSFVIAHEWGHLAGYADESEANFFAWLICRHGGAPAEYSAWISLYGTIISSLPPQDRRTMAERLQPGPRADLRAMSERISRQVSPAASRAGYAIYDRFLKANRVPAGIRSYNEVIRLLLGTRFNSNGSPVLLGMSAL
jgi:hypothetical protein